MRPEQLEARRLLAITLRVLPDLTTSIVNTSDTESVALDGYYLHSAAGKLSPDGWRSLADWTATDSAAVIAALGPGGASFGEAVAIPTDLAELNLANSGIWGPGTSVELGRPVTGLQSDVPATTQFFFRKTALGAKQEAGAIELIADSSTPTVGISPILPQPAINPVDAIEISFSESVEGFDLADVSLRRDGASVALPSGAQLSTADNSKFLLSGLAEAQSKAGEYRIEIQPFGSQIVDQQGFALLTGASETWDLLAPLEVSLAAVDSPRRTGVDAIQIAFSSAVTGLDLADLSLARDGGPNLLTGEQTLSSADNATWTLSGLTALTGAPAGVYRLALSAPGSGIQDAAGRLLNVSAAVEWTLDLSPPTVDLVDVDPDPHAGHVNTVGIAFSEPVRGLDLADLSLEWSIGARWDSLVGSGASIRRVDPANYEVRNLPWPWTDTSVTLTLRAPAGITDFAGNALQAGANETWFEDFSPPSGSAALPAGWLNQSATHVDLQFSELVVGLEQTDLILTRDGGANLLTGEQALVQVSDTLWRLENLSGLTAPDGLYSFELSPTAGLQDRAGNGLLQLASLRWKRESTPTSPTVDILDVSPDPHPGQVNELLVVFSEPVTGFDPSDVRLEWSDGNRWDYWYWTFQQVDPTTFRLADFYHSWQDLRLKVSLVAPGGITDLAGIPLQVGATEEWFEDITNPTGEAKLPAGWLNQTVTHLDLEFTEPVVGLEQADLELSFNGGPNLLTAAQPLSKVGDNLWRLENLTDLTNAADGEYVLRLRADAGVKDLAGNALSGLSDLVWRRESAPLAPTVDILDVAPDPHAGHIDSVQVVFSEPVRGLTPASFRLEWSDGNRWDSLPAVITRVNDTTYRLDGLPYPWRDMDVTLTLVPAGVTDLAGNPLAEGAVEQWTEDVSAPWGWFAFPPDWSQNQPLPAIDIYFNEAVTGFEAADLILRRAGGQNLLTGAETLTQINETTWRLANLSDVTTADGSYQLSVRSGNGIRDRVGNALSYPFEINWLHDQTPPTVDLIAVQPDPRATSVNSIDLRFSEYVSGVGLEDLRLSRGGGPNLLMGTEELQWIDGLTWRLRGLAPLTRAPGEYTFSLVAAGSQITDGWGNSLAVGAADTWSFVPQAAIGSIEPSLRNQPLAGVSIEFTAPVSGFDLADLSLSRNGGPNLLTPGQTLTTVDNQRWWLGNLWDLTAVTGAYQLQLGAAGSGITTAPAIPLLEGAVASWTLDSEGPQVTGITLAGIASGASPDRVVIEFSEAIQGASLAGLSLSRDGGPNLLGPDTPAKVSGNLLTLTGLGATLAIPGDYRFRLNAVASALRDGAGNPVAADAERDWQTEAAVVLRVGADGSTQLINRSAEELRIDGYLIESLSGRLEVGAWRSINDWVAADAAAVIAELGADAVGFGEANPGPTSLAELNLSGGGLWKPGQSVSLGQPFGGLLTDIPVQSLFTYHLVGIQQSQFGSIELVLPEGGPTAQIVSVAPDPRNVPVDSLQIAFSQAISGFDLADLRLVRNGLPVAWSDGQALTTADNVTWTLSGLTGLTGGEGWLELTLPAFGSGIVDAQGRPLAVDASEAWRVDALGPTAAWQGPRALESALVDTVRLEFSEPIEGLELADLELSLAGGANLLTANQTLRTLDNRHWVLSGLAPLTGSEGQYTLRLPADRGVQDSLGNPLASGLELVFAIDRTSPTVDIVDVSPDPGPQVKQIELRFSEPVEGLTKSDFRVFLENGSPLPLYSARLQKVDDLTWTLTNLADWPFNASGNLRLEMVATRGTIRDLAGNPLAGGASDAWQQDASPPWGNLQFAPDWNQTKAMPWIEIQFSEPIQGFEASDLILRRGGAEPNLLTSAQTLVQVNDTTWRLENLTELTTPDGYYELALKPGSGITDLIGNDLLYLNGAGWIHDQTPPTATVVAVSPDPRDTPVDFIDFMFSEEVVYWLVDPSDLSLTRNGGPNLLTGNNWIQFYQWPATFRLYNLTDITQEPGNYVLTVGVAGTDIQDWTGNRMVTPAVELWSFGFSGDIRDVTPDPRNQPVEALTIAFSEAASGFELADLTLARDGGANLLTAAQTLTTTDNVTWTLGNLAGLSAADGTYVLTLKAEGSGIKNPAGEALRFDALEQWTADFNAPTAAIQELIPAVRTSIDRLSITLSEPLANFGLANLSLTRNGQALNLAGWPVRLTTTDQRHWTLSGLNNLTHIDGEYELAVVGGNLQDAAGNALLGASRAWTTSNDPSRYHADFNDDNVVDLVDFELLRSNFFSGSTRVQGDADGDGDIDLADFAILKAQFGGPPPGAPRPGALATVAADRVFDQWGR